MGVLQDFFAISRIEEPFKLLDKYRIDHVLVPEGWSLVYLLKRTPGWQVVSRKVWARMHTFCSPGLPRSGRPVSLRRGCAAGNP